MESLTLTHPETPHKPRPGDTDRRYTDPRATHALLDVLERRGVIRPGWDHDMSLVDPCCGTGAILEVLANRGYKRLIGVDPDRPAVVAQFSAWNRGDRHRLMVADWLALAPSWPAGDIYLTNVPYSSPLGPQLLAATLSTAPWLVACLLQWNHLGRNTWAALWDRYPPECFVSLRSFRPSHTGDGKTDMVESCWVIWSRRKLHWPSPVEFA